VVFAVVLGVAACGPVTRGAFGAGGYTTGYGYDVAYQAGTKQVLPPGWNLDNFRVDDAGTQVRKTGRSYVTTYAFDDDEDGHTDERFKTYIYALRYEHTVHSGTIWLRNLPVARKLRTKDLRVLMQDYIDEISAATYETEQFARPGVPLVVVERRQAAAIIEQGPATIAGQPAYAATIDVANVDQLRLTPGVRARRIQLVLMRAPEDEKVERDGKPTIRYPVIALAGYSNMPADFSTGLDDFHGFLRLLTIGGHSGLTLNLAPAAPGPPPPEAPPPEAAPPPPVTAAPAASP